MKRIAKAALFGLFKYSGVMHLHEAVRHLTGRSALAVLLFHRVTDEIPEDGLTVSTTRFRRVCRMLRDRFKVVPVREIHRLIRLGGPLPRRTVAITFDDCYRDNLGAAHIMADHGLPACFFLPAGLVGTAHTFPWDRHLGRLANLTWDDVREMAGMGFEFGSHTVSHPNLATLADGPARREIFDSKKLIEDRVGRAVHWFAYPYGGPQHFRPEQLELVLQAGYAGCLSGYGGFVNRKTDPRLLPREDINFFHCTLQLELHLAGCLNWLYALKRGIGIQPAFPEHLSGELGTIPATAASCDSSVEVNGCRKQQTVMDTVAR
jgi:peptidoglycan/xylan/chitin deacetylase (PgdA/CDA1 family)